jgi:transcriptional regulator of NAD metabolism
MTGEMRRTQMLRMLKERSEPISGTALAKHFHVSRQVVVQDIALMRAENQQILSTNKGYLCRTAGLEQTQPMRVFYVRHEDSQVLEEFMSVLDLGGRILDVAVEHELYGQIRVDLMIETVQDARSFTEKLVTCRDNPLKVLTGDCHYHTVAAPSERLLDLIEEDLRQKGFLQPDQE